MGLYHRTWPISEVALIMNRMIMNTRLTINFDEDIRSDVNEHLEQDECTPPYEHARPVYVYIPQKPSTSIIMYCVSYARNRYIGITTSSDF